MAEGRLQDYVTGRKRLTPISEIALGATAAGIAIGVRYVLPFQHGQLPTASVVVLLAVVTTFVGLRAGIVTAVLGGLGSWYLFLAPAGSWRLTEGSWVPALGYVIIAIVILTTSHLYRTSQQTQHQKEIARLQAEAETSRLFARELAHRLGNTLAIVQSIAQQTMGRENADSRKFAGRLKALAEANRLLTEHVETPTADVMQVIETALQPFQSEGERLFVDGVHATIETREVLSLSLALHELATNSMKYGALSGPAGSVLLKVEHGGSHLELTWKEQGGPLVYTPEKKGFGTKMLLRSGITKALEFEADGLRCCMRIPNAALG